MTKELFYTELAKTCSVETECHEPEAAVIRRSFAHFLKVGSATLLAHQLRAEDAHSHRGRVIDKGAL